MINSQTSEDTLEKLADGFEIIKSIAELEDKEQKKLEVMN